MQDGAIDYPEATLLCRMPRQAAPQGHAHGNHAKPYPNDSDDYRRARTALLAEEIELRRHIERVAELTDDSFGR